MCWYAWLLSTFPVWLPNATSDGRLGVHKLVACSTLQVNNAGIMGVTMEVGDEAAIKEMVRI